MSYDYNALVATIRSARQKANEEPDSKLIYLQEAMEAFESLSMNCPMTPLLWIQYALTAHEMLEVVDASNKDAARETFLETLQLGLMEFPGSAMLQMYFCHKLDQDRQQPQVIQAALDAIGKGSHRNEDAWVADLYRMHMKCFPDIDQQAQVFVDRASVPMREENDALVSEYHHHCQQIGLSPDTGVLLAIEDAKRKCATIFGSLATYEDEIDAAMHQEGIPLARHFLKGNELARWDEILLREQTFGMGLGGNIMASAFIQYAKAMADLSIDIRRSQDEHTDDFDSKPERDAQIAIFQQRLPSLVLAIYERAVAECPTVEAVWLAYVHHVAEHLPRNQALSYRLQTLVGRAVRNCPCSSALITAQLDAYLILANHRIQVLDPDQLLSVVQSALDSKFLPPSSHLTLYLNAIRVVKRRIQHLLCSMMGLDVKFDESLNPNDANHGLFSMDDAVLEEVQDLLYDLPDMFEFVEQTDSFKANTVNRSLLWKERACSEIWLLNPLNRVFNEEPDGSTVKTPILRAWERAMKAHNPPHPHYFVNWIRAYHSQQIFSDPSQVIKHLCHMRFWYERAFREVGPPKTVSTDIPDFGKSLSHLADDWIDFERTVGSEKSLERATSTIRRKWRKLTKTTEVLGFASPSESPFEKPIQMEESTTEVLNRHAASEFERDKSHGLPGPISNVTTERMPEGTHVGGGDDVGNRISPGEPTNKKQKLGDVANDRHSGILNYVGEAKKLKGTHPFTIKVSNFGLEAEDMDLVDAFRPRCGPVIHARIVREKHNHNKGRSKGWGLVQFEERDSVLKALELNDVLGIAGQLVKVERSAMPAVSLTPPGMHRISAKGEGKSSKRNLKRKAPNDTTTGDTPCSAERAGKLTKADSEVVIDILETKGTPLAFQPRGVGLAGRRKAKLALTRREPSEHK